MGARKQPFWWGDGAPPLEMWPGVTVDCPSVWRTSTNRWESPDGRFFFDASIASRACDFYPDLLRHHIGEFAGRPFELLEYQAKLLTRPLFGWKRTSDGLRRFRKLFGFLPKGAGKSPWAAGAGIWLARCDGEAAAEVYAVANDRQQARTVHDNAKIMVEQSPILLAGCEILKDSIYWKSSHSTYMVLSSDAATAHGKRPHGVLFDELHGQRNRDLYEALKKSMIKRRQPMMLIITHAGTDDEGICFEEYEYAKGVLSGTIPDDACLPVIFELRNRWTESLQSFTAIERLDTMCTCHNVPPILIHRVISEACARSAICDGGEDQETPRASASTIQAGQLGVTPCAPPVTSNICSTEILTTKPGLSKNGGNGRLGIQQRSAPLDANGVPPSQASGTWQTTTGLSSMECPESNTNNSERSRRTDAESADKKPSYTSIIATLRSKLEAYSASTAISESVISEILQNVYEKHSPTCDVRSANVSGLSLQINHPADDWTDPKVHARVNPGHGITVKADGIATECLEAQSEPRKQNDFKRFHGNVWTNQATAWIPIEWWDACDQPVPADEELAPWPCAVGIDMAQKIDLAAAPTVFKLPIEEDLDEQEIEVVGEGEAGQIVKRTLSLNYRIAILPEFWMPEATIIERAKQDGVRYDLWEKEGLVHQVPGAIVGADPIVSFLAGKQLARFPRLKSAEFAYDPAFATDVALGLRDTHHLTVVEVLQNYKHLSEACQVFEALVKAGRVLHGGHKLLRWNMENVAVKTDDAGRIRPVKPRKATKRIDGVVAVLIALTRLMSVPLAKTKKSRGARVWTPEGWKSLVPPTPGAGGEHAHV